MAFRVNTNISAVNTQRWLGVSSASQSKALERLSSGYKINKAADDAAGIAITTKLNVKSVSMTKSIDNGNQALSMLQTAEGGMDQISNILTRLKELSIQAASDNTTDRTSLDNERSYLETEISNIARNTQYGTTSLLQGTKTLGSTGSALTAANGIANIDVSNALTSAGSTFTLTMTAASAGAATVTLTNGTSTQSICLSGLTGFNEGTANFSAFGVKVTVNAAAATIAANNGFTVGGSGGTTTKVLDEAGLLINSAPAYGIVSVDVSDAIIPVNYYGLDVAWDSGNDSVVVGLWDLNDMTHQDITILNVSVVGENVLDFTDYGVKITCNEDIVDADACTPFSVGGQFKVKAVTTGGSSASSFEFQLGDTSSTSNQISAGIKNFEYDSADVLNLAGGSIATKTGAQAYMTRIDTAMNNLTTERGNLGASMNQISYHVANLVTMGENIKSSVSTIKDADFAAEMADFTKAQILQQSGVAMLAQANSIPQQILSLLKG